MTGGIAFVLDETGEFRKTRCNPASVDLEQVDDSEDIDELHYWIARHAEETGSPRAQLDSGKLGRDAAEIRQSFPARIQAGSGRAARQGSAAHALMSRMR